MKTFSRRDFLKLCAASGVAVGLSQLWIPEIAGAVEKAIKNDTPVIWIQGSTCNGCTNSFFNSIHPGMKELLTELIDLNYHPGIAGFSAPMETARQNKGKFILVVEGAVPKANKGAFNTIGENADGEAITLLDLVTNLGNMAGTVISVGTCSSFGGIAAVEPNDGYCVGMDNLIDQNKVINVPGCPPHPDWIIGTLTHVLLYGKPDMDDYGRPVVFYGSIIHNNCPRRQSFDNSIFAKEYGEEGCMLHLGCKGPLAYGDCPTRHWNGGSSWCVSANAPCIGCTDPNFPELTMPFNKRMSEVSAPGITATPDAIGVGMGIVTAVGIGVHLTGSYIAGRVGTKKVKAARQPSLKQEG